MCLLILLLLLNSWPCFSNVLIFRAPVITLVAHIFAVLFYDFDRPGK